MERRTEAEDMARVDDIKKFWPGFQKWRSENASLEQGIASQIDNILVRNGYSLQKEKTEIGLETAMLFFYGVELAKTLKKPFTNDVPVPSYFIREDAEDFTYMNTVVYFPDWKIDKSFFEIAFWHIVYPQYRSFSHVNFWGGSRKTVSEYLPDWVIVDNVIAGAEEYAHELLKKKSPERIMKLRKETAEERGSAKTSDNDLESRIAYHAQTVERRAMVWQNRILKNLFPHWMEPFRKFTAEVSERRLKSMRRKNSSLRKLLKFS